MESQKKSATISNDERKDLEMKAVSTIHLSIAPLDNLSYNLDLTSFGQKGNFTNSVVRT